MRPGIRAAAVLVAGAVAAGLAGCAAPAGDAGKTLTVFAAASLKAPFTALAEEFEAAHPGTTVTLSFAGSSDLATQISQGAPADVFASADTKNMAKLSGDAGLVEGSPRDFATNVLTIAVPPENPASIASFADLARPGVKVVICAAQVPCGAATKTLEQETGTTLKPVSEESSVTDVLGKVVSGRGRRRAGLRHGREGRRGQGAGDPLPRVRAGRQHVSDRRRADQQEQGPRGRLHRGRSRAPTARQLLRGAGFGTP